MEGKKALIAFLILFSMSFISSTVTCDNNVVLLNYNETHIPSDDIILTSCTSTNVTTINFAGDGVPTHIQKGTDMNSISGTKNLRIQISDNIPPGIYSTTFSFQDSSPVYVVMTIHQVQEPQSEQGEILVFPLSKVISVQQGVEKTQNILITVPQTYPRTITISQVDFNPGTETIRFGDLNLGQVAPGQSISIPIVFSGMEAQVGTYSTGLSIFATDSEGQIEIPTINLQLQVTAGLTPVTNETFSTPPNCALSASIMNLNSTYSFTCSGVVQNLEVNPQYNEFFEGIAVDLSSGIYSYTFKPVGFGNTNFVSLFTYKGSPIFAPFSQEVKISSSTSVAPGTSLKLLFTPTLEQIISGQEAIVQLVDNKSGSLVESPEIYIDAVKLIPLNNSEKSFPFVFTSGKNYEIRGGAPGYNDLTETINVTSQQLTITLEPNKESYYIGDTINISSNANDTVFQLGESIISSPYTFDTIGDFVLKAIKQGYITATMNISVVNNIYVVSSTPQLHEDWKKGERIVAKLNENVTWEVEFSESDKGGGYLSPVVLASGSGEILEFNTEGYGVYSIKHEGVQVASKIIEKRGLSSFWNNRVKPNIGWWILGGVVVFLAAFLIFRGKSGTKQPDFVMEG